MITTIFLWSWSRDALRRKWRRCLVLTLSAALMSVAADPRAATRDPYHDHVVMGGDAVTRARALARHLRLGHPVTDAAETTAVSASTDPHTDAEAPHVMDLQGYRASGLSVFSSTGSASLAASPVCISPPAQAGLFEPVPVLIPAGVSTPSPDPPPRAS